MRKPSLITVFLFLGFLTQPVYASPIQVDIFKQSSFGVKSELIVQPDINLKELVLRIFNELGLDARETDLQDIEEKSCTVRIRGTYQGKEVDITITFIGVTCKELLKMLM